MGIVEIERLASTRKLCKDCGVNQIMEFNDEQWTEAHRGSLEHMPNLVHEKLQLCGSLRRDVTMEVVSRTSKLGSRR